MTGSDNVCYVIENKGLDTSDSVITCPEIPQRVCAVCAQSLTPRQRQTCSRRCASRIKAAITHARHPQGGSGNFNYRGGRSEHPILYTKPFKSAHPEIVRAHRAVATALKSGALVRPTVCASCLQDCRPDAHHPDYRAPLCVEWLCRKCHRAADRQREVHGRQSARRAPLRLRAGASR